LLTLQPYSRPYNHIADLADLATMSGSMCDMHVEKESHQPEIVIYLIGLVNGGGFEKCQAAIKFMNLV
jgi:hypothetical protein